MLYIIKTPLSIASSNLSPYRSSAIWYFQLLLFVLGSLLLNTFFHQQLFPDFRQTNSAWFSPTAATQTITFPKISNRIFGNNTLTLHATASSGLPVSYQVLDGPATVSGSTITITEPGVITVEAFQNGNGSYEAATPVQRAFVVDFQNQDVVNAEEACLENTDLTFVVLGSSTAAGYKVDPIEDAWVYRFEAYLKELNPNNTVYNFGVNGYTSYRLMPSDYVSPPNRDTPIDNKNITYALSLNPDGIIVNCPSNDVRKGYLVEEFIRNFKVIFNLAMANDIPIWITTTQPRSFTSDSDEVEAIKVSRQIEGKDIILDMWGDYAIDFWSDIATEEGKILDEYAKGDSLHINNDGHALFFQEVLNKNVIGRTAGFRYTASYFKEKIALGNDIVALAGETVELDAGSKFSSYAWSTGSTSRKINITQSGYYSVTVTNAAGCSYSDAITVTFEEVSPLQLSISPANPTMENLMLKLTTDDPENEVIIKFIQTTGRQQANLKVNAADMINGLLLKDLIALQSGTYYISLWQGDRNIQQQIFINP